MTNFEHKGLSPETLRIIEKSDAETTPQAIMSTPSIKHAWMQPAIQKAIKKAVKHDADSDETADTIDYFDRVIEPRRPTQLMWRMLANVKSLTSEKFQIRRKEKSHLTKTGRGAGTIWSYGERNEYYTVPLDQEIVGNESVDLNMIEDAGYDIQGDVLQSLSMDYDVYMNQLVIDKIAGWLNTSGNIEARAKYHRYCNAQRHKVREIAQCGKGRISTRHQRHPHCRRSSLEAETCNQTPH